MKKVILICRMQWKDKDYIKSSNSVHFANNIHSTKKLLRVLSVKTIYMFIQKVINKRRKTKGEKRIKIWRSSLQSLVHINVKIVKVFTL